MSNIVDITSHTPRSGENYFFDCNVWLFNFCPIGNYSKKQQDIYSAFLSHVKSNRANIFINSLVLSEFANRYLRLDFDLWSKSTDCTEPAPEYKRNYVSTKRYKDIVILVEKAIRDILKLTEKTSDDFHRMSENLDGVYNHFQHIDFNDSYYYEFCKKNDFMLVSDDKDFAKIGDNSVKILTLSR